MRQPVSIRRRLLTLLITAILLAWSVALAMVFRVARQEVEEVFDADLARSAKVFANLLVHEVQEEQETNRQVELVIAELREEGLRRYPQLAAILNRYRNKEGKEQLELTGEMQRTVHKDESKLALLARYSDGSVILRTNGAPDFPLDRHDYFNFQQGDDHWRVFGLSDRETGVVVAVGEQVDIRQELVYSIACNTMTPALLALPLMAALIRFGVGRGLRPLLVVANAVRRRQPDELDALPTDDTPQEVQPLLSALNGLFNRVRGALDNERRFTAEAAHELRTPLAALKTHIQVVRGRTSEARQRQSLDQVLNAVDRVTHLVEQLMLLARADAHQRQALLMTPVDLRSVALEVVSSLSQAAIDKDIDLGLEANEATFLRGDDISLSVLMRNLIDNAIRYTPDGGVVTARITTEDKGRIRLDVSDNGPGVPPEDRGRLFDRFHRGPGEQTRGPSGAGLGLSIVQRVAQLHGARVELGEGLGGTGLTVSVLFPVG